MSHICFKGASKKATLGAHGHRHHGSKRGGSARGTPQPPPQPMYYPGEEEEYDVSHNAFHKAFEDAKPAAAQVPGLQELAAAIWERRKIPSRQDPLLHIFDEFDMDNDGVLSSGEIVEALKSRGVAKISKEQVQWLIDAFERTKACALPKFAHVITRQQWPDFVYSLTVADMNATSGSGSDAEKSFDG